MDSSPQIIRIEADQAHIPSLVPPGFTILAQFSARGLYHAVLARQAQRLRLSVRILEARTPSMILLAPDDRLALRARAVSAYADSWKQTHTPHAPPFAPSPYQRAALIRLLMIADALACGATSRDIAYSIVFPHHHRMSGASWKGSSERRHCWRLIHKARWMIDGGYRTLLCRG